MAKQGLKFLGLLTVVFTLSGFGWQSQVADSGFVPLEDLDLIKVDPSTAAKSEEVLLGTALPWRGLSGWWPFTRTLEPANNPLRPTYSYAIKVVPGPSEFKKDSVSTISVSALKIGAWANLGISGTAKENIHLNNLFHGFLKFDSDGDKIPFFIGIEPLELQKDEDQILWITEYLAADIDNFTDLGLSIGVTAPIQNFPVDIKLSDGSQVTLKGLGLLLGVKGQIATSKRIGMIQETALPVSGPKRITIPLRDGRGQWTLLTHRNGNDVQFEIAELAGAIAYVKDGHDNWKKDVSTTTPVVANLASQDRMIAAVIGDGITRVILVKTQLGGGSHIVASLVLTNDNGSYRVSGQAYEVSLRNLTY